MTSTRWRWRRRTSFPPLISCLGHCSPPQRSDTSTSVTNAAAQPVLLNDPEEWMLAKAWLSNLFPPSIVPIVQGTLNVSNHLLEITQHVPRTWGTLRQADQCAVSIGIEPQSLRPAVVTPSSVTPLYRIQIHCPSPLSWTIHPLHTQPMWHWAERLLVSSTYFQLPPQPQQHPGLTKTLTGIHWEVRG